MKETSKNKQKKNSKYMKNVKKINKLIASKTFWLLYLVLGRCEEL